jgi:hypothetical protein
VLQNDSSDNVKPQALLDPDEIHAQVNRLVHSKTFETSEVHRKLLQYLAEKAIHGEADRLKEYTIGLEAFGKPATYDPKHDSIVRLQVGRLRQKLTAYYQAEGPGDSLVVNLPKGGFKLNFEVTPLPVAAPAANQPRQRILYGIAAIAVLWAVVATVGYVRLRSRAAPILAAWNSPLEELWAPFFNTERPLLVCLGTPLFVRIPEVGFFRDPKVNDWPAAGKSERFDRFLDAAARAKEVLPAYTFTGIGEASAAVLISKLLAVRKREVLLTRSNLLSWQQIVDDDVVFVGPPKFNPQLQTAALTQDLVIEPEGIRNRMPAPGEPPFLQDKIVPGKPSEGETHALITMMTGPSGAGHLLMIAGNASPDTMAAAEWLTDPRRATELVNRLLTNGELPPYFQVVLKVSFKQGIPLESSYVFHHVLKSGRR